MAVPALLLGGSLGLPAQVQAPQRITLSVREADWKNVLRAATENTDLNLSFDPDLDTRVQGLDLKGVTLTELLDDILPSYGLGYTRNGRSLHIVKSDGGLKFYQVDSLALRRTGSKDFSVSASGQTIQAGTSGSSSGGSGSSSGGGQNGSSSAYTSNLRTGTGTDPWQELQVSLINLVFGGSPPEAQTTAQQGSAGSGPAGPVTTAYYKDGKSLIINPGSGMVAVAANVGTQHKVERYLAEMRHRSRRQVLLEAKIVEVTLSKDSQLGVDWNSVLSPGAATGAPGTSIVSSFVPGAITNPNLGPSAGLFTLGVANARVSATLSALARDGKLTVLSSPRLTALNNQKAILRVVQEQAYFLTNSTTSGAGSLAGATTSVNITPLVVPVGIVLDIQPQIGDDGSITLAVNPSVSSVVSISSDTIYATGTSTPLASANLPVVNRRDLDTVVRIQSGETLILAGIIQTSDSVDNAGVPWLKNIPLIGQLFNKDEKSKSRTELAIFITPTLLEDRSEIEANRVEAEKRLLDVGTDPKLPGKATRSLMDP
jgi:MSHA type pilus biogenesis protein MshL